MSDVVTVDDNNFETEVLQSDRPVLVDFSAVWCGPCQRQLPIIEKFASENKQRVKVCKVDVDDAPTIAAQLGIKSVPSILLFNSGKKIDSKVGLTSLAALDNFLLEKVGV
jgi:thioredoxin 1